MVPVMMFCMRTSGLMAHWREAMSPFPHFIPGARFVLASC